MTICQEIILQEHRTLLSTVIPKLEKHVGQINSINIWLITPEGKMKESIGSDTAQPTILTQIFTFPVSQGLHHFLYVIYILYIKRTIDL